MEKIKLHTLPNINKRLNASWAKELNKMRSNYNINKKQCGRGSEEFLKIKKTPRSKKHYAKNQLFKTRKGHHRKKNHDDICIKPT